MLSMHDEELYWLQALKAGASGYVLKSAAERDLVEACRAAMRGDTFLYPPTVRSLLRAWLDDPTRAPASELTAREEEVVKLVAESHTSEEIADLLHISRRTVERHRENILAKLGLTDRIQLTRYAIRRGSSTPDRPVRAGCGDRRNLAAVGWIAVCREAWSAEDRPCARPFSHHRSSRRPPHDACCGECSGPTPRSSCWPTLVLVVSPLTVSFPIALVELVALGGGLVAMLVLNLALLRRTFRPLGRLTTVMRGIDPLRPGERATVDEADPEVAELTAAFNDMLGRLEVERRDSARRALAAQEGERRRIARELHDEVGQALTAVILQLDRAGRRRGSDGVAEARESVRSSLEEVRGIARRLRPEALDDLGLRERARPR